MLQAIKKYNVLFVLFCTFLFAGCTKDLDKIKDSWNPAMALPIIDGSMSFEDLVAKADSAYIKTNPDKSIHFVYKSSFPSPRAEELIPIPNQALAGSYSLNAAQILTLQTIGSLNIDYSDTLRFAFSNNERIDQIEFKGGNLDFTLRSMVRDCVEITLGIPALRDRNGVAFNKVFDLNFTGQTLPIRASHNIDLNGYRVDLTVGNTSSNKIPIDVKIRYKYIGNPIATSDSVRYDIGFSTIRFSFLDGYFGKHTYAIPSDSIALNMLNNAYSGKVTLSRPQLNIYISNSYGLPLGIDLRGCEAITNEPPPNDKLRIFGFDTLNIAAPALRTDPPAKTVIRLVGKDNPGVKDSLELIEIIKKNPRRLDYAVGGITNPSGVITQTNFVKDSSTVRADIETIIPLELSIKGLAIQDTFPFNMDDNKVADNLDYIKFKFITQNGFPVNIGIQAYFVDASYNKIDSLISPYQEILSAAIPSNPADPASRAVPAPHKVLYFTIDNPRVLKVVKAKYIILKGVMSTYNQGTDPYPAVRFYSDYKLKVKLGVIAQGKPLKNTK